MVHKPSGGSTSFENMSHEQMLQWLDQANSGVVQAAADRLTAAAKAIREIADDLKIRPQYVEWKGEGASAFRTWSGDLANATLRLGDYSEGASKWLARASGAIAEAQASTPRDTQGSEANLAAAQANRNDPDAAAIADKSLRELAATKEANRQEAAAQMRKLGQTYQFSAQQMAGLEKPAFPPPPAAVMPTDYNRISSRDLSRSGEPAGRAASAEGSTPNRGTSDAPGVTTPVSGGTPATPPPREDPARPLPPVGLEIDGATLPTQPPTSPPSVPGPAPAAPPRPEGTTPPMIGTAPPLPTTRPAPPAGPGGRSPVTARPPAITGPGATSSNVPAGRPPANNGIVGGRPTPPATGRPPGTFPRGPVIGSEPTPGRVPTHMGHGAGMGTGGGGTGQGRQAPVGRYAREAGGVVGGTPQQGRTNGAARFTAGGSGLGRGVVGGPTGGLRPQRRPDDQTGERPDYLSEDEETWQTSHRRPVPPVIE